VEDWRFVEAGYDESADVGEEGDEGWLLLVVLGLELGLVRAVEAVCALVGVGREGELGVGVGGGWGSVCAGWCGGCDWVVEPLEGQTDVD